ncbi:MAG TPA: outer membrane beta-barrel protein [Polyangiaceae bacterium]|nr:outer membrane beta-barrel protein [Polyangiaceae bacterium]
MGFAKWVAAAMGTGALLTSVSALAEPATANSIQLGLGLRYGIEMNEGDFNPWGLGLGLNGGITLPNAVYVGGVGEYFFGDKEEAGGVKLTGNIWQLMAEGGYDVGLGPLFVLRPKVGLGLANSRSELCLTGLGCTKDNSSDFALAPGATFLVFLPMIKLSADVRYELVFAEETGKALIWTVGVGF